MKDNDGKIVVEEYELMEVWRAHYDKISNEEFASETNVSTQMHARDLHGLDFVDPATLRLGL